MKIFCRFILAHCIVAFILLPTALHAQNDSAIRATAIANAISEYHKFIPQPSALYTGPEYVEYFKGLKEGQPFFLSAEFSTGSIMYDNVLYEGVPLKLDLVKNQLVAQNPVELFKFSLFPDKIGYFTLHGHLFVHLLKDSGDHALNEGFYDLLYKGRSVALLGKPNKRLLSLVTSNEGIVKVVEESNDFYIKTNNGYYRANTKKALLNLLQDKRAELRQYIRRNHLSFDKETIAETLTRIVRYYDDLKNNTASSRT